jgi:UDP-N-acetylmuramate--alanine ligase
MGPEGARFDVTLAIRGQETVTLADMRLPMAGNHNMLNALAAIAVSRELGVSDEALRTGLAAFGGVRRRFTTTGVSNGIRVIDDYGHHPVEIASVLTAARSVSQGKVIAVVQPHRFTRLRDLFQDFCACFNDADEVIVADVYTAGEAPIPGIDRDALVAGLIRWGHRNALPLGAAADLPAIIARDARPGDVVVLLGAGDITAWAYALPAQLDALSQ